MQNCSVLPYLIYIKILISCPMNYVGYFGIFFIVKYILDILNIIIIFVYKK